ncbi:MAG: hypothetical protein QW270_05145 [Candidatus Bathyarchaeia archaeon]
MGHVFVEVKLTNPLTQDIITVPEAVVDTGATFTTIPQILGEKLRLKPFTKRKVRTSGEEELAESILLIRIQEEETVNPVLISPRIDRVLVGVLTLEALGLKVEPKTGKLEKTELLLLLLLAENMPFNPLKQH